MKRLLSSLFLSLALTAGAAERIELFVAVTNTPVTGDTLTINGTARTWTNAHSSATILTNLVPFAINNSMTNLFFNLSAFPLSDRPVAIKTRTNQIRLIFQPGVVVSASEVGDWAEFSLTTNTLTTTYAVRIPATVEASSNRTIIGTGLADYLAYSTNAVASGSVVVTNLIAKVGGYGTNNIFHSPKLTNGINYGSAFQSPGTGSSSLQLGVSATATATASTAVGNSSDASGAQGTAIGNQAVASGRGSTAVGEEAEAKIGTSVAFGSGAVAGATNSMAIGFEATVGGLHTNSVALGANVSTTTINQFIVGSSTHVVQVPGRLEVSGTQTNSVLTGPTKIGASGGPYGTLSIARKNITSLASGANSIDVAGASFIKIPSGPSAAFSIDGITNSVGGNLDGQVLLIENLTTLPMTLAHRSGLEVIAANRINTTTGFGETFRTNGIATLIYDSQASEWILASPPRVAAVYGEIMSVSNVLVVDIDAADTYYVVTNFYTAGRSSGVTLDVSNHRIQISSEGDYEVDLDPSFSGTASSTMNFAVFTNGVESHVVLERKLGTGGDVGAASRSGIMYLPTNCIVDVRVRSDSAAPTEQITMKYGGLKVKKIQ